MSDHEICIFKEFIDYNENCQQSLQLHPSYYQLGFICSVQAIPEIVDLEQWLAYLWQKGDDISFENELQAADFANNVLKLVAELQRLYEQAIPLNALDCDSWIGRDQTLSNDARYFSAGFLAAIELFNAQWLMLEDDPEAQNLLQTTILLLTKMAPSETIDPALIEIFEQLPDVAEIVKILPQLISNLAYSAASTNTEQQ